MSQTLDPSSPANKQRQNNVRRWADRLGYRLHRDPGKMLQSNDFRCYQLEDVYSTTVTFGVDYDLSLHDVEAILQDEERSLDDLERRVRKAIGEVAVIT
jgi:hypothetical protein